MPYKDPEKQKAYLQAWWKRNPNAWKSYLQTKDPDKVKARMKLNHAIRLGNVAKLTVCEKCGSDNKVWGHHPDYAKPLEVVWLCILCHRAIH